MPRLSACLASLLIVGRISPFSASRVVAGVGDVETGFVLDEVSLLQVSREAELLSSASRANGTRIARSVTAEAPKSVCSRYEALGLYKQADSDFAEFRKGLSPQQETEYLDYCKNKDSCITMAIKGGEAFVYDLDRGYQSRHEAVLHAIYRVLVRFGPIPDCLLTIEVSDGWNMAHEGLPIFTMTKKAGDSGVLFPDFTFFSWPESQCPGERSHAYNYLLGQFQKLAASEEEDRKAAWEAKTDLLFWRGAMTGNRAAIVQTLNGVPHTDVALMHWSDNQVTGDNEAQGCATLLDNCKYKYLAFLNGNSYSSRLKYLMMCGSTIFASQQLWGEWWTGLLEAGKDYVQVSPTWQDASAKLEQLRSSADGGRAMAENARAKVLDILSQDAVDCYWQHLFSEAAANLPPPPAQLPPDAKPLEDVLLFPLNVGISEPN